MIELPLFWLIISLLIVLTLWVLSRPLRANSKFEMQSIGQRNIAIARERAKEIDSAFDVGDLNEQDHKLAKHDLQLALADELASSMELTDQYKNTSSASHFIVLALIPLLAVGSYFLTSNYQSKATQATVAAEGNTAPSFEEIFTRLEAMVEANPEDQQGLFLLAQSYARLQRYEESAARYRQLIALVEPSADLWASLADVSAMANNQRFTPDIAATLDQALALDPENVTALWLGGLAQQQLGEPETALRHWLKLKPLIINDAEASGELALLIKDVDNELGSSADKIHAEFGGQASVAAITAPAASLTVRVSLDSALQTLAAADDTVFIFAKAKTGPPMPLAAARHLVSDLPITVSLDDSMAMMPQMKLSNFNQVLVGARISKSGQVTAQVGDLQSQLVATPNHSSETIALIISEQRR